MTENKTIKYLNEKLTRIAMDCAEWVFDVTDDGSSCPKDAKDCFDTIQGALEATSGDDAKFEEERLLLLGAMTWGCENTWIDWDKILEYVKGMYDAKTDDE